MADLPDRLPSHQWRVSDADRERTAAALRHAAAEGRLDLTEVDERLGRAYAARTYGDLEPLTRDLPSAAVVPAQPDAVPAPAGAVAASTTSFAVMSEVRRQGRWVTPRLFRCLAFWGGGRIDLREAVIPGGDLRIRAVAVMGGIDVVVPEDAEVHVTGIGVMGGFDQGASGLGAPGAPRIVVSGFAFWGGVTVRRKPRPRR